MRHLFATALIIPLILAGCGAGTDTAETDVQAMPEDDVHASAMGGGRGGGMMGGLNTDISLDPEIANAWSGIRVHVVDSETGDGQLIDVSLSETVVLGESGLTLSATAFVPDFVMDERGITSRSAETHNPAARVVITEEGMADYEGWLFAAMPEIHPYPHERYQVLLVEGIPAE
ncbi:MAG: DUF2155 domain-containing protein [Thermoanaerobaculales bacterium]|nr:DUF2155 domain-containing protein [Thermoanaerobaculales bacterium]